MELDIGKRAHTHTHIHTHTTLFKAQTLYKLMPSRTSHLVFPWKALPLSFKTERVK